ncbi:hypothetical protein [Tessaracoccus sp. Z1128]
MPPITVRRVALPVAALVALGLAAIAQPAAADPAAIECVEAGNVWVHVEHDDVVTGACATEFATGTEAMVTTGLAADQGSYVTTIDGVTSKDPQWWSLWTATPADGDLGEWEFSQVGIAEMAPEAGQVIGWRLLEDYNEPQEAPLVDPLEESADAGASGSAEPTASEAVASDATATPEAAEDVSDEDQPGSGVPTGTLLGAGAVVALAVIGGVVWWRRRGQ